MEEKYKKHAIYQTQFENETKMSNGLIKKNIPVQPSKTEMYGSVLQSQWSTYFNYYNKDPYIGRLTQYLIRSVQNHDFLSSVGLWLEHSFSELHQSSKTLLFYY